MPWYLSSLSDYVPDSRCLCSSKNLQEFKHRPKLSVFKQEFKQECLVFEFEDSCFLACSVHWGLLSSLLNCHMLLSGLMCGMFGGLLMTQAMGEGSNTPSHPSCCFLVTGWLDSILVSLSTYLEPGWCYCFSLPDSLVPSS